MTNASPAHKVQDRVPEQAMRGVLVLAHHAGVKGWVPATSGNFSLRIDDNACAITASGGDKGTLAADSVIRASIRGPAHPRASAEAPLHYLMYRLSAAIGAVAHVHAQPAVLASLVLAEDARVRIEGLELLKAFSGIKTHDTHLDVPIFDNEQDMATLAERVEARLMTEGLGFGFLLAGHGLYAWGANTQETLRHLDAFDYLFTLMLKLKGIPA
jgi:methylthioribulose-1-phosphate dehydratase